MVETLVRSDQRTDAIGVSDGFRARKWTRAVACMAEIAAVAIRVWSPAATVASYARCAGCCRGAEAPFRS